MRASFRAGEKTSEKTMYICTAHVVDDEEKRAIETHRLRRNFAMAPILALTCFEVYLTARPVEKSLKFHRPNYRNYRAKHGTS